MLTPPKRKFKIIRKTKEPAITFVLSEKEEEENENEEKEEEEDQDEDKVPALTRYLYIHTDVEYTLRTRFDNPATSSTDEVIYWAYELYFSGYVVETVEILSSIYNQYFSHTQGTKFQRVLTELIEDDTKSEVIGTIAYNLFVFVKYRKGLCAKPKLWVNYRKCNIAKFCNKFLSKSDLSHVRRYRISPNPVQLYNKTVNSENWVYYAYYSPLWRKRINLFRKSMILDHDAETIRFNTTAFNSVFGFYASTNIIDITC